jgi:DNA-directed RNA polymerase subunit F
MNKSELFDEQISNLEEELNEILRKAEKILGHKAEDINETVEELLSLNNDEAEILAADIVDIEDDMIVTEENYEETIEEPFNNLYNEDEDPDL